MRDRLLTAAAFAFVARCTAHPGGESAASAPVPDGASARALPALPMSDTVLYGMRLSLTGPSSLPLDAVRPESPTYDPARGFFTVTLQNVSPGPRTLPLGEVGRGITLVYRDPSTGAEFVDNRTPPPRRDGAVERVPPGAGRQFQVVFEYPTRVATLRDGVAALQFCVRWNAAWLRTADYARGAYDWNESFELCRAVRVVRG